MRLTELTIRNFIGARDIHVEPAAPVLIFAGENESGKSSTAEAITLALTGEMTRVAVKKDYQQTVSDGATSGQIALRTSRGDASFEVPTGKWGDGINYDGVALPTAMRYVLRADRFASLDTAERRRFLLALTGKSIGATEIARRLGDRGVSKESIDALLPELKSGGFDAGAKFATVEARDAKGQWREVTGEQWGEKKAAGWKAPDVSFDKDAAAKADAKLRDAKVRLEEARETKARVQGALEAEKRIRNQIAEARSALASRQKLEIAASRANDDVSFLRDEHAAAVEALNKIVAEIDAAKAPPPAPKKKGKKGDEPPQLLVDAVAVARDFGDIVSDSEGVACYHQNGDVAEWGEFEVVDRAAAVVAAFNAAYPDYAPPQEVPEEAPQPQADIDASQKLRQQAAAKKVTDLDAKLRNATQVARNATAEVEALAGKAAALEQLEAGRAGDAPSEADYAATVEAVTAAQNDVIARENEARFHETARKAADEAAGKTQRAARIHGLITDWIAAAEALSPNGIPAEIVAEALAPINAELAKTAQLSGWPPVTIGPEMTIRCGGRRYELCSESQKWRADAAVAAMIASVSGLRFIVLDRIDMNSIRNRMALLKWLHAAVSEGFLDGAVLLGTLKEAPKGLPAATFTSYWLERGATLRETRAAA